MFPMQQQLEEPTDSFFSPFTSIRKMLSDITAYLNDSTNLLVDNFAFPNNI